MTHAKITPVRDLVAEARSRITNLSVEQAAAALERGAVLVDLREADERQRDGAIPGAVHVPRGMLEFCADPASPYHRTELGADEVVLYCASGGRSALAAERLREMGFGEVAHLDGGYRAWREAGRPVARPPA